MNQPLTFIVLLFCSSHTFGQKKLWDTTFYVKLQDTIAQTKIVVVHIGKKATIYLKEQSIRKQAEENLSNDFIRKDNAALIHFLDSASLMSDTITADIFSKDFFYLSYLISDQLQEGNARVYYNRIKSFVDTISHRLERFGEHGDRFFYLPDKRPFFVAALEISGILDGDPFTRRNYQEYKKEGEKLQSIQQE